jgi:hypothetical protein
MPFLTLADYEQFITEEELNAVTTFSNAVRLGAEAQAQAKIKQYLLRQYDTVAIFSATGTDRHIVIIEYMVYFTLFILFGRNSKRQMSEARHQQYMEARDFFESVKNDEITTDFPRLLTPENEEQSPAVRGGSTTYPY